MWDLSSLTRGQAEPLEVEAQRLNHWTTRDVQTMFEMKLPCGEQTRVVLGVGSITEGK